MTDKERSHNCVINNGMSRKKYIPSFLHALGITCLAFLLSFLLASPMSFSLSSLFSLSDQEEKGISDFYTHVANQRPVRTLEDKIVIVDIGNAGRDEIAELLEVISLCEPKAIGLDVMFTDQRKDDERLLSAIASTPNLVLPISVEESENGIIKVKESSYFSDIIPHSDGVANLVSKRAKGTIREFPTWFRLKNGDSIASFPVAVALTADSRLKKTLKERDKKIEIIDYPSHEFVVIPIAEAIERSDEFLEKIVLIGAFSDVNDIHSTPIASMMPGVLIHAYGVNTIISERYYSSTGIWGDWTLAFILCLVTVWISILIDKRIKGLLVRLLQLLIVYLVVQIGYYLFIEGRIIVNLTYTMLMITFGMFASDLWFGSQGAFNMLREKKRHV